MIILNLFIARLWCSLILIMYEKFKHDWIRQVDDAPIQIQWNEEL